MKLSLYKLLACSLVFNGCSKARDQNEASPSVSVVAATALQDVALQKSASVQMETSLKNEPKEKELSAQEDVPVLVKAKQIVRTAHLTHEVRSNKEYNQYVRNLLNRYSAYIFKEDNSAVNNNAQTTMVIKVPVELFDSLIVGLVTRDVKQLQKNISTEDITAEVIDARARLETRKATRDKYLEFLSKAVKIEDVLKIQQEINNIQEDIESAEARLSQLSGQASYSTINLTYFEPGGGYNDYNNDAGFWSRIGKAIKNGAAILGEIFIAFVTAWPFWVVGTVLGLAIRKYRRRNRSFSRKDQ